MRRPDQRGLDGSGETYEFGEEIGAVVGDPEIAAGIDGDGVGLGQIDVGGESSGG